MNTPRFARLDRAGQLGCAFLLLAVLVLAARAVPTRSWVVGLAASLAAAAAGCLMLERFVLAHARSLEAEAAALRRELAERVEQQRRLRHDLRGAMSPVLLVADRLTAHADPAVKRTGDIMVRTVERATALLAEADPAQAGAVNLPAGS